MAAFSPLLEREGRARQWADECKLLCSWEAFAGSGARTTSCAGGGAAANPKPHMGALEGRSRQASMLRVATALVHIVLGLLAARGTQGPGSSLGLRGSLAGARRGGRQGPRGPPRGPSALGLEESGQAGGEGEHGGLGGGVQHSGESGQGANLSGADGDGAGRAAGSSVA